MLVAIKKFKESDDNEYVSYLNPKYFFVYEIINHYLF
jgi:hypothetical protein